jgi:hypothetical protein
MTSKELGLPRPRTSIHRGLQVVLADGGGSGACSPRHRERIPCHRL